MNRVNPSIPSEVVTRIAPSPTGVLHVGTARTALFNYLFAKKHTGTFIVRIEDTDKERSKKEYEENIIEGLAWLGLAHDAFYRQSDRTEIYRRHIEALIGSGKAYISTENPTEPGQRSEVIRLKNPGKTVTFNDLILGDITTDTAELGDFVIARSIDDPLYHLAVVIDDYEMGVTHVIRGQDGVSNTPRQILILEALGLPLPTYAHIPFILAADKSKLSKRHGAVSLLEYKDQGFLPEAIINYLALLGWSPQAHSETGTGTNQEILTLAELIESFDIRNVQKAGAVFNIEKLRWINKQYIKKLGDETLLEELERRMPTVPQSMLPKIVGIVRERIETLGDIDLLHTSGEFDFLKELVPYPKALLKTTDHLEEIRRIISQIPDNAFNAEGIKDALWNFATEKGRGNVLWPLRVALSGKERSPDPFSIAAALGKEESLNRLSHALSLT